MLSEPSSSASLPRLLRHFMVFDCIVTAKRSWSRSGLWPDLSKRFA